MDIAGITIRLVLPAILLAACLQTAWANETNKKKSPQHFFSVEYVATYDKTYKNDILRFQYRDDNWTLKYDMNPEDQDEYCIDFNAIDTEKNKLVISHLGSIEETIDGKLLPRIYDFSLCYTRYIGTLPLLGKSSIKLYSYSSIKRKENIEQKYRIGLLTSHLEFIYQYRLDETRTPHANYYGYYHNSFWALSIGRAPEQRINATLVLKKPPIKSVAVFDYYIDTETFQVYAFNALKNGDTDFYHEAMADVSAWLVILGDKGVNMFYVPTFLAFG
ncbi:MAG: hypothetical protein GY765_24045, partial [bacterium]|nr:hypothetical protein [bacterium]